MPILWVAGKQKLGCPPVRKSVKLAVPTRLSIGIKPVFSNENPMIRLLQGLFASMSLERKCLLFFGSALLVLMFGAFLVVEKLATRLVINTTRTRARDFSAAEVLRLHDDAIWSGGQPAAEVHAKRETLRGLRDALLDENLDSGIDYEILALEDQVKYDNLPAIAPPKDPDEIARLKEMRSHFYDRLSARI